MVPVCANAGFQAKIQYWGANHGKNQFPPAPERWFTSIKLEITLYERMEFEPENRPIDLPYSDIDIVLNELTSAFKKYLIIA